ncbi:MAG: T9SS type A sorting domain-containing protein [Bacteroidetes bacterium]|nr:T9SS type A sorting domain-containing protein [Bacteroidota bacterium]
MRLRFLLLLSIILSTVTAQAQVGWYQLRQTGEDFLFSVDMLDANTITAVGSDGLILHSTDGGSNWTTPVSGASDNLRRVRWHSPSLGVILGNGGVALKSIDGGASWQSMGTGTTKALFDVHFFDADNWLVIGQAALRIATSDGGQSWEQLGSGSDNFNEIDISGDFGAIVGNKGLIRYSRDGGKSWRDGKASTNLELTGVSIGDDSTAVAVGANGTILRTQDGGRNWSEILASIPISSYRLSGVRHLTREHIVISGYFGIVLWSTDTGLTWNAQESNTQVNLEGVAFATDKIGVTVGWDGTIMRTNTAGTLDIREVPAPRPTALALGNVWPQPLRTGSPAQVDIQLPAAGHVSLRVYDLLGRQRLIVHDAWTEAGTYTLRWNATTLPKGVYLYRLEQGGQAQVRKFTRVD